MREADVALRLREPSQPDLIRRHLFAVHYHLYASAEYLRRHGQPHSLDELIHHRLLAYAATPTSFLNELNAPLFSGARTARTVSPRCRSTTFPPCSARLKTEWGSASCRTI